jgi:hypothetical protein
MKSVPRNSFATSTSLKVIEICGAAVCRKVDCKTFLNGTIISKLPSLALAIARGSIHALTEYLAYPSAEPPHTCMDEVDAPRLGSRDDYSHHGNPNFRSCEIDCHYLAEAGVRQVIEYEANVVVDGVVFPRPDVRERALPASAKEFMGIERGGRPNKPG